MSAMPIQRACEVCGKTFFVERYRIEKGHGRFCSMSCTLVEGRRIRWERHQQTLAERLAKHRVVRGPDECWGWTAFKHQGYGRIGVGAKSVGAHRVAYMLEKGDIPKGLVVLHSCDNPECTNPAHLSLGTPTDNNRDRNTKGRQARGERIGAAKLTEAQVAEIRTGNSSLADLALRFGCSASAIAHARVGQTWQHLPGAYRQRRVRGSVGGKA